nr:muscle M-line assembly protein unc-89-like isoform X2 [Crassostrea gigas]
MTKNGKKIPYALLKWTGNNSNSYDDKEHWVPKFKLLDKNPEVGRIVKIKWYGKLWTGIFIREDNFTKADLKSRVKMNKISKTSKSVQSKNKEDKDERKKTCPKKTESANSMKKVKKESGKILKIGSAPSLPDSTFIRTKCATQNKVGQHKESSAAHTSPHSSKFHNTSLVEVTNKRIEKSPKSPKSPCTRLGEVTNINERRLNTPSPKSPKHFPNKRTENSPKLHTCNTRLEEVKKKSTEKSPKSPKSPTTRFGKETSKRTEKSPKSPTTRFGKETSKRIEKSPKSPKSPFTRLGEVTINKKKSPIQKVEPLHITVRDNHVNLPTPKTSPMTEEESAFYTADVGARRSLFNTDSSNANFEDSTIPDTDEGIEDVLNSRNFKMMGNAGPSLMARSLVKRLYTGQELDAGYFSKEFGKKQDEIRMKKIKETILREFDVPGVLHRSVWKECTTSIVQMLKYNRKKTRLCKSSSSLARA